MNGQTSRIYQLLGSDYLIVPEDMRDLVVQSYSLYLNRDIDKKQLLLQLEEAIKKVHDTYWETSIYNADRKCSKERECLRILLEARRKVMNRMFSLTQDTYNKFLTINNTLLDLSKKVRKKVFVLYDAWLKDEEAEWRNDCEMSGRICAEAWEETETDETGSDYCSMMEIIEEIENDRNLFSMGFSGAPDIVPDNTDSWHDPITSCLLFSGGGKQSFGDFTMCRAFYRLYHDTLYSRFDILRIKMFWADATITHQRIVTPTGELL